LNTARRYPHNLWTIKSPPKRAFFIRLFLTVFQFFRLVRIACRTCAGFL
jgi:hypothetical protein